MRSRLAALCVLAECFGIAAWSQTQFDPVQSVYWASNVRSGKVYVTLGTADQVTDIQFVDYGTTGFVRRSTPILRQLGPKSWMGVIPLTMSGLVSGNVAVTYRQGATFGEYIDGARVYVYQNYPDQITSITQAGGSAIITGTFFSVPERVLFNGVPASFTTNRPANWVPGTPYTSITAAIPAGATTGPITLETSQSAIFWATPLGAAQNFVISPPVVLTCINPLCKTDVTSNVSITRQGPTGYSRRTGTYTQILIIENTSGVSINGPLFLLLANLSHPIRNVVGVTTALTPTGIPYINLAPGPLAPGASASVAIEFQTGVRPTPYVGYTPLVFAGAGNL